MVMIEIHVEIKSNTVSKRHLLDLNWYPSTLREAIQATVGAEPKIRKIPNTKQISTSNLYILATLLIGD